MKDFWIKIRPALLVMLPTLGLGFLGGTVPGYKLYKYTWKDARFCTSCHVHDYATVGWETSVHGQSTTCHDCHHQPLMAYLRETWIMVSEKPKFPRDLHHTPHVKTEYCGSCHLSGADASTITGPLGPAQVAKLPKVENSKLHKAHLGRTTKFTLLGSEVLSEQERDPKSPQPMRSLPRNLGKERSIGCADCHGGPANRGHSFTATDISCVRCHGEVQHGKVVETFGCRTCHFQDFLTPLERHR